MTWNYDALYPVEPCASFADFLEKTNERYGTKIAFCSQNQEWTYHQLYQQTLSIAHVLTGFYRKNIGIKVENPYLFCISFFAVVLSGNVAVLLDGIVPFCEKLSLTIDDEWAAAHLSNSVTEPQPIQVSIKPHELAVLAHSSGTTSVSKWIMLSQTNLLTDMRGGMQLFEYPTDAVYLNLLPYHHLFGVVADMLGALYSGAKICFSDSKFRFFSDLRIFRPTNLNLPPVIVEKMVQLLEQAGNSPEVFGGRLKKILCAGAALDDTVNTALHKVGVHAYTAYGLTECSPCVSMSRDHNYKIGSAGKILPCCEAVLDDGELIVRGPTLMLGYYQDPVATKEVLRNGWLFTGDLAEIDSDGYLYLKGRKSSLIVFEDGTKQLAEDLENDLVRSSGIQEARILPVIRNGRVRLKIQIYPGTLSIEKSRCAAECWIRTRHLKSRLDTIEVVTVPFERTALGKLKRTAD